jgi:hypothetical protein
MSTVLSANLKRATELMQSALDSIGKNFTGEAKHELFQLETLLTGDEGADFPDRARWLRMVAEARDALVIGGSMGVPRAAPILRSLVQEARRAMVPKAVKTGLTLVYDRDRDEPK